MINYKGFAIKSYDEVHNTNFKTMNVCNVFKFKYKKEEGKNNGDFRK